jgi:hypothetical protein
MSIWYTSVAGGLPIPCEGEDTCEQRRRLAGLLESTFSGYINNHNGYLDPTEFVNFASSGSPLRKNVR